MASQSLQSSQKLAQSAVITPALQRALKILQVPATELRAELAAELAANPVLEEIEPVAGDESPEEIGGTRDDESRDEASAEEDADSGELHISADDFSALNRLADDRRDEFHDEHRERAFTEEDAERRDHFFESHTGETSFQQKLLEQARDATRDRAVLAALIALIGHLDERGYLTDDPRDLALEARLDPDALERARVLLRAFDPPGLGARDLRECLLFQLEAAGRAESLPARILAEAYDELLKRRFSDIAKKLGVTLDGVRDAVADIGRLDPAPARRFVVEDAPVVSPDVIVRFDEDAGAFRAELTGEGVPRLRINPAYKDLLHSGRLSPKDRAYLSEKIKEGAFLRDALVHRQSTLLGVAERLLVHQPDFFERGRAGLRPLVMQTIAADLGVHETTISRAVSGKWMRTPHGLMEMRDFFSAGYATAEGGAVASAGVKEMLAEIVAAEDPDDPLSDDAIADALEKKGVKVARRTVAKYREAIGIQPRYLRRRRE